MQKIRIFVSSPSDVAAERRRVDNVVKRIQADYDGVEFEVIRWEETFYTARSTFQDQITSPADVDLVLCILWKRLGSALPENYQRKDGSSRTGTEYEFETAMEAALTAELPDILVYRGAAEITFSADRVEIEQAELQALESFWRRWIQNEQGHFTAGFKPFDNTDEFEKLLEKDLRAWLKRRFHHVSWPENMGSPYRGLEVFDEEHAPIYFGRHRAISEVRARLIANEQRDGVGFLLILGASGAGKSSLVRAGLIPALKDSQPIEGVAGWRTLVLRPAELGADPIHGLVSQLSEPNVLPELLQGDYTTPRELSDLWHSSPTMASKPVEAALKRWGKVLAEQEQFAAAPDTRLIITIDQFEELFQFDTEQQVSFLSIIDTLSRSGKVWIIATMRSDFYPQLFSLPELLSLKDASRQYDLNIPRPHELLEIITGPATAAGLIFEQNQIGEGLEQKLLEDAEGNPAALPLLEFTLDRLYQERDREEKKLSFTAYEKLGGLQGALTQTAEEAFSSIDKRFSENADLIFARVMRELVAIDEQGKATRRVARLDRFINNVDEKLLIDTLVEKRLLTGYTAEISETDKPEVVVNITHEALIHYWARMQHWLEQDQELLQVRERINQDCQRWINEFQRRDLLATSGKRLEDIRYLKDSGLKLDEMTSDFIHASLVRAKQLHKRKRVLQVSFSALSITAAIFGVITLNSLGELSSQRIQIGQKEKQLINSQAESTALIAESEYAKANLLKNQRNNVSAFNSYYKAIERARESGEIRLGELDAGNDNRSKNKSFNADWLSQILKQPTWHLSEFNDANQLTTKRSFSPLVSPNKETALIISADKDWNYYASLIRLSDKTRLVTALPASSSGSQYSVSRAAYTPDSAQLALLTPDSNVDKVDDDTPRLIKLIDTSSGTQSDITLSGMGKYHDMQFIDSQRLVISGEEDGDNVIKIWDIRESERFNDLASHVNTGELDINKLAVISENLLLLNNQYLWRSDKSGAWSEIAALNEIDPFNAGAGKPEPILTENGFITIVSENASWSPTWALPLIANSAETSPYSENWIEKLSLLKVRPKIASIQVINDTVTTEYTDIPLPSSVTNWDSGYVAFPSLLKALPNRQEANFIVSYLNLDGALEIYHYAIDLNNKQNSVVYDLILSSESDNSIIPTGFTTTDNDTALFSFNNGEVVLKNSRIKNNITVRPSLFVNRMTEIDENLTISTEKGAYLIPKTALLKDITNIEQSVTNSTKKLFSKYQTIFSENNLYPKISLDTVSYEIRLYHGKPDYIDRRHSRSRGSRNQEAKRKPTQLRVDNLYRLNISGDYLINIIGDDTKEPSILAVSQSRPALSDTHTNYPMARDKKFHSVPITLANFSQDAEHLSITTNDNALHIFRGNDGLYVDAIETIKNTIHTIATGAKQVAAATTDNRIHIVNIKDSKRFSFNVVAKTKPITASMDNGAKKKINPATNKNVSSMAWQPASSLLAMANWQGDIHLFNNRANKTSHLASALHENNSAISQLSWSHDGKILASGDRSGNVNLWQAQYDGASASLSHLAQLKHDSSVISINFSLDGQWLLTATDTDKLYFWRANGTAAGKPIALDDIQISNALISEDNWGIIVTAKDNKIYLVEAGDRFIPDRVIDYFDLQTRNELFIQRANETSIQDADGILDYYRKPPNDDKTYWTALINRLLTCSQNIRCVSNE